jgi:hypothetical protein
VAEGGGHPKANHRTNRSGSRHTATDRVSDRALQNLKKRWKKKPEERDAIQDLVAVLFPEDATQIVSWLNQN